MSAVASKNPFALLGDEEEEVAVVAPVTAPKAEVVKKPTSSKKVDQPPAKADPAKANPNKKGPTGNEAAFRDRNAGREKNRSRATGGEGAPRPRKSGPRDDRHSKTAKTDSEKQVTKGWGDDSKKQEDEIVAENIAKEDATAVVTEETTTTTTTVEIEEDPSASTKTLDEYFAELSTERAELNALNRSVRKANEGADDAKWTVADELKKEEEDLVASSVSKNLRAKNRKEKTVLEAEFTFTPPSSNRPAPRERGERGERSERSERGERRGGNGPRRGGATAGNNSGRRAPRSAAAKVNVNSVDEFPTLGA